MVIMIMTHNYIRNNVTWKIGMSMMIQMKTWIAKKTTNMRRKKSLGVIF